MKQYKAVNNLMGWLTFVIAAFVYCSTIESTASFWDCPEFITTGYKLEVGHPPGAPFFMLTANLFSQFASDASQVARMVNYMSALMSAACIMFLFWSITHLVRKLIIPDLENVEMRKLITVMGCGLVGALVYTFSDTFWFSAVEGEVYAYSSLFTAVVFWLILKWEDVADEPHSDRWLILIAYLTGLSIGVHLLNLLCLPALVLVYYYKRVPDANLKGSLLALFASMILVAVVLYGIVPGVVKVGGCFELFFVNTLGMKFNTGVVVYLIVLAVVMIWGVRETYLDNNRRRMNISFLLTIVLLGIPFYGHGVSSFLIGVVLTAALAAYLFAPVAKRFRMSARAMNTTLLCTMLIMIGYSSYAVIVIRSTANTPMDQNSPEDIFTLGEYMGREQYGTWPLFYGQTYASKVELKVEGGYCVPVESASTTKYIRKQKETPDEKDSYVEIPGRTDYKYAQNMFFPRMYSSTPQHVEGYKSWVDVSTTNTVPYDQCGETIMVELPTQWDNIRFFFRYQLNFMYWRYFMWNFVGRQNDIQGSGEIEHGNWITGFNFIDKYLVGDQSLLPSDLKNNKGHNVFYCLPLLLGIIGLLWQAYHSEKGVQQFWVVFFLFFMTGIAIVLYLNQTPGQPRERDYAYAGSFYAFAIWVGMGVAGLVRLVEKYLKKNNVVTASVISLLCVLVPIQMAGQTWDDHDRSGRYVARDFGQNYLNSLQEGGNPIIFTNGDNDTFPLWYNIETEGVRTDARTCNLSYLQTDWYIDQMKRPAYDSPALPITWPRAKYSEGNNEYIAVRPELSAQIDKMYAEAKDKPEVLKGIQEQFGDDPYELKNIIKYWVLADNEALHVIPTDSIVLKIDKEAVRRSGITIPEALGDSIPEYMHISLKGKRALYKSELMMLEMLANANWERPIYIASTVGPENRLGLDAYLQEEGLASRYTPFNNQQLGSSINTEKMYTNLMTKFKFGGVDKKGVYIDENVMRMCYTHRRIFTHLIGQLIAEGKMDKAKAALDYADKMLPGFNVPYDWSSGAALMAEYNYQVGNKAKGDEIMKALAMNAVEYATWYMSLDKTNFNISSRELQWHVAVLSEEVRIMKKYNSELADDFEARLEALYDLYGTKMKMIEQ